jgi:uncharacterized membrane protein
MQPPFSAFPMPKKLNILEAKAIKGFRTNSVDYLHHMLHAVKRVDARVLWANNLLLFWMSLIPFVTVYMGQNHMAPLPVALYGVVMTLSAAAFSLLRYVFMQQHRGDPEWCIYHSRILRKNLISMAFYAASVPLAFVSGYLSFAIFVLIALAYFLPEPKLAGREE